MPRTSKPEETKSIRINITLPPELDQQLRDYAAKTERPVSWVIQKAVAAWLEQNQ